MKMRNLLWISISLFCISCYKDKGNYDYKEVCVPEVTGIESSYRRALSGRLEITPLLETEDRQYDYMWMYYRKGGQKIDTLSFEKNLEWTVSLPPAVYKLVFAYRDKLSRITRYVYSELTVESEYSRGWYVLKRKGDDTDIDFFSPEFKRDDLISGTMGRPLKGRPKDLGFIVDYAWLDEVNGKLIRDNMSLITISESEVRVIRLEDLKIMADFDALFFEKPTKKAPGKWFGGSEEHGLINDGKVFTVDVYGPPFGASKFAYAKGGNYRLADMMTKNGTMCPLLFDLNTGKFCTVKRGNPDLIYLVSDDKSAFPEAYPDMEPLYAGFLDEGLWEGGKGYVVMQKKEGTKKRVILHFDLKCLVHWEKDAFKNRITDKTEAVGNLAEAECFGMNRTFPMLYFSKGDKLYYYDLKNKKEYEVGRSGGGPAVPVGEHIRLIKHIVFNNAYEAPDEYVDRLAVATGDGKNYKLYLFETVAGKLKDDPVVYAGEGSPSEVMYMNLKMRNSYICY